MWKKCIECSPTHQIKNLLKITFFINNLQIRSFDETIKISWQDVVCDVTEYSHKIVKFWRISSYFFFLQISK